MKTQFTSISATLFCMFITLCGVSQEFQGTAYYKSHQKVEFALDSTMSTSTQAMIQQMLADQLNNDFELTFDQYQSYYKKLEKLEKPSQGSGVQVMVMMSGGEKLYKNITQQRYTSEQDLFGKLFLVKDSLQNYEWKLSSETKQIGQYTCYKATRSRMTEGSLAFDNEGNKTVGEPVKVLTTVWYAPQIPVSNGPGQYWGLPGLILEVTEEDRTLICVRIELNSSESLSINEPTKGKVISAIEFDALMEEKLMEMQKMNHGGKKKGRKQTMEISIQR